MNPQTEFEATLTRIATATSIIRTRKQDEIRRAVHGGENDQLLAKVERAVSDLRKTASKLEEAIA